MLPKFKKGDKVRFTNRVTKYITNDLARKRTRTITAVSYNHEARANYYRLNERGTSELGWFRSYELEAVAEKQMHTRGKPPLILLAPQNKRGAFCGIDG